ncbi:hypothetical protein F5148DRAFT_312440 [Russula earlei]|uniref:Uncharacterized protein n=1 Tax=Russula earlei TaxID=71964 RepID=A0ACC0U282_9AGAM|nr:hypothetical protein F5148DRAFT_312440 [Russula earlei]
MHPSFRIAHRPLISFIGKRQWPSVPQPQRPHPAAPAHLKEAFSSFLETYKSLLSPASNKAPQRNQRGLTFNDFWEAPEPLWRPKIRHLEDAEIDAVLSGGASLK